MADIFVSYARADRARVAPLVAALEAQGWSVWWDPAITGGQEFDELITRELQAARATIVVWTPASVASRWVRGEARMAADRGVLVPVQFGAPNLPLDARAIHTIEFDAWREDAQSRAFQDLLRALEALLRQTDAAPRSAARPLSPAGVSPKGLGQRIKLWHVGALAGVLLFAVAVAVFITQDAFGGKKARETASITPTTTASEPVSAKPRLAVMPFENLSPDPDNAFFTDGMHEEILTALSNDAPGLDVISRTTMMTYKDHPASVEQIAKDLSCTHVLEGSVRREGDHVRLTLQLIDARTDEHVWAQNYDRKLVSAMTLQSEVAGEVAKQLVVELAPSAQSGAPMTTDPVAYDLYLKAKLAEQSLDGTSPVEARHAVVGLLDQAIARDPSFVQAYLERSLQNSVLFFLGYDSSKARLALVRKDLDTARHLAPDDPGLLTGESAFAMVSQDYERAEALFDHPAQAENAANAFAGRSRLLAWRNGDYSEVLVQDQRAAALDPANPLPRLAWWWDLIAARKPQEALRVGDLYADAMHADDTRRARPKAFVKFLYTGRVGEAMRAASWFDPSTSPPPEVDAVYAMGGMGLDGWAAAARALDPSTFADLLKKARAQLDKVRQPSTRLQLFVGLYPMAAGQSPFAENRGWIDLMLDDGAEAAKEGREIRSFLAAQEETKWNRWHRRVLDAEASLFLGDKAKAIEAAHEAVRLAEPAGSGPRVYAKWLAAGVLAWAGAGDDAAALLDDLANAAPGIPPAYIAYAPKLTRPLAENAHYKALKAKLEAQMAATKL